MEFQLQLLEDIYLLRTSHAYSITGVTSLSKSCNLTSICKSNFVHLHNKTNAALEASLQSSSWSFDISRFKVKFLCSSAIPITLLQCRCKAFVNWHLISLNLCNEATVSLRIILPDLHKCIVCVGLFLRYGGRYQRSFRCSRWHRCSQRHQEKTGDLLMKFPLCCKSPDTSDKACCSETLNKTQKKQQTKKNPWIQFGS